MGFLATLVGLTSVERFIPLATHETERRDVLARQARGREGHSRDSPLARRSAPTGRHRPMPRAARRVARNGEHRRTAETTRQMPVLPSPARADARPRRVRRGTPRTRSDRPPSSQRRCRPPSPQPEHVVIADAVRLLGWGQQWHELADMIARLAERPGPSEIRRILRTYRDQIDAVATRRRD